VLSTLPIFYAKENTCNLDLTTEPERLSVQSIIPPTLQNASIATEKQKEILAQMDGIKDTIGLVEAIPV
jgi:hypothetical protein